MGRSPSGWGCVHHHVDQQYTIGGLGAVPPDTVDLAKMKNCAAQWNHFPAIKEQLMAIDLALSLEEHGPLPLHRQLYAQLRRAILEGRLAAGSRMPSTRALAAQLRLSRNTVSGAYDQLLAE